ncbi:hypothetical protein [Streptomyces sp. NPDC004680]|uniref:hypothetical protein n=1 Tax=Streptomyces sp. NPDC004680 TaxID=3154287 RepID=UPI0033AB4248
MLVVADVRRLREKNVGAVAEQTLPESQIWSNGTSGQWEAVVEVSQEQFSVPVTRQRSAGVKVTFSEALPKTLEEVMP